MFDVRSLVIGGILCGALAVPVRATAGQDPPPPPPNPTDPTYRETVVVSASKTEQQLVDAPATITRLIDMGLEPFNVASALNLITAQRLVRRIGG